MLTDLRLLPVRVRLLLTSWDFEFSIVCLQSMNDFRCLFAE